MMTELCALALFMLGLSLTALIAVHFFRLGMENAERREQVQVQYVPVPVPQYPSPTPAFTQRLPGQEPGYVEELPDNVIYVKGWIE